MDTAGRLDSRSDAELIDAANGGDEAAFEILYYRHRDWVLRLAYRWTRDQDLALDVLQETFFAIARRFPGFRLTAKLQTFLFPVVRNLSVAARRKSERYRSEEDSPAVIESLAVDPAPDGDEALRAALNGLGAEHRDVLLLRFVDGLDLSEIAEVLGIPIGTVKSRLHNALDRLRQDERTRKFLEK